MIGSAHDGEALNAARLAHALAIQLGGWQAVLLDETAVEHELAVATAAVRELLDRNEKLEAELRRTRTLPRARWVEPHTISEKIDICCANTRWCSEWERTFLVSIASRRRLSEKQEAVLERIVAKVGRFTRWAA
jgi:hypothetical protein